MPIQKSAWKELRKTRKRHQRNIGIKSELKTFAKKLENLISSGKKSQAMEFYKTVASKFDKAASSRTVHKNTASRKKARLMKKISKMAQTS